MNSDLSSPLNAACKGVYGGAYPAPFCIAAIAWALNYQAIASAVQDIHIKSNYGSWTVPVRYLMVASSKIKCSCQIET